MGGEDEEEEEEEDDDMPPLEGEDETAAEKPAETKAAA